MRIFRGVLVLGLALGCSAAQAQAYRWVDKDGKVRYGDVAPPGVKATPLRAPPSAPPSPPTTAGKDGAGKDARKGPLTPAEQEQAYRERQMKAKEDQEKMAKEQLVAEQRKQNCASAQDAVRMLQSGRRVSSLNANGETVFLEEAQKEERIAQASKVAAESCK